MQVWWLKLFPSSFFSNNQYGYAVSGLPFEIWNSVTHLTLWRKKPLPPTIDRWLYKNSVWTAHTHGGRITWNLTEILKKMWNYRMFMFTRLFSKIVKLKYLITTSQVIATPCKRMRAWPTHLLHWLSKVSAEICVDCLVAEKGERQYDARVFIS